MRFLLMDARTGYTFPFWDDKMSEEKSGIINVNKQPTKQMKKIKKGKKKY